MTDRERIAWLHRRAGFGLTPGALDAAEAAGVDATLDALVDPDGAGTPTAPDPWAALDFSTVDPQRPDLGAWAPRLVSAWLGAMATTPRPLEEWSRWYWHGHLVSGLSEARLPQIMVEQLRLFGRHGLGHLPALLRAVTVDPAMLLYLNGDQSHRRGVNENYGRELLELFSLGEGNYDETDVRAAAVALTGWRVQRGDGALVPASVFLPDRHDDGPRHLLGVDGVHDVDTVIDAVVAHEACAPFVAGKLARAILGPDLDDGVVTRLAADFAADGLEIRPLVRAILEAGLDGAGGPLVSGPVSWVARVVRAIGAPPEQLLPLVGQDLRGAGQIPMFPPNVGGWPGGRAWLSSSTTVARLNMAGALATATLAAGAEPLATVATGRDVDAVADALGYPDGFGDATRSTLADLPSGDPAGWLAVALAAPEVVLL